MFVGQHTAGIEYDGFQKITPCFTVVAHREIRYRTRIEGSGVATFELDATIEQLKRFGVLLAVNIDQRQFIENAGIVGLLLKCRFQLLSRCVVNSIQGLYVFMVHGQDFRRLSGIY